MYPTVYVLRPETKQAEEWIEERIDPNAMRWGKGVVIEHRYVDDIMYGIELDGLTDEFTLSA